jgi:ABC-2 type transport system ATP-binding protein
MIFFEARNVSKKYANHLALDKVSIEVPENGIFGLLGPNGAGKTSLIRIINQITAPDEGELYLHGKPLRPEHITQIGYLPEERGLYKKMKVGEQAMYLAQLKGVDKQTARKRLTEQFEKFEIDGWWNRKVEELSKGMQQKIQFIVTIIHQPKLLIFDEPFSGFDPINVNLLKSEIIQLQQKGATIIFSTHNMASVEELCEHIALINASKKILDGKVTDIKNSYRTNTYALELDGLRKNIMEIFPDDIEVLEVAEENNKRTKLKIRTQPAVDSNDLLKLILPEAHLISFQEVFPSMNDIFIQCVQNENANNGNTAGLS